MTIFGVDLGTSRSTIGFFKKRAIEIIADDSRDKAIPSVAYLSKKDEWIFGSIALKYALKNPERLIYDTKRMLGHKFNDKEIIEARKTWQFNTREEPETHKIIISINLDGEILEYYPYQISGLILKNLVDVANHRSVIKTNKIVVTIPATFNDLQREELKQAADSVGLQIVRFINEPISATIAYEFMNQEFIEDDENTKRNILVFDLGAGTLDISFIQANRDNYKILAFDGDPFLGGRDWDNCLYQYVTNELKKMYSYKQFTPQIEAKIRQKCEIAKINLSETSSFTIVIEGNEEKDDMKFQITREKFYSITNNLFKRCTIPIEKVLKAADLAHNDIDNLIMVGGSTNMPKIRETLLQFTNDNIDPYQGVDPEEAVAYGACIIGAKTNLENMMTDNSQNQDHNEFCDPNELEFFQNLNLLGVCNVSFGIQMKDGKFDTLIPNKFQIPCKVSKEYSLNDIDIKENFILIYENIENSKIACIGMVDNPSQLLPNEKIKIISEMTLDGILTVTVQSSQSQNQSKFEPNNFNDTKSTYSQINENQNQTNQQQDPSTTQKYSNTRQQHQMQTQNNPQRPPSTQNNPQRPPPKNSSQNHFDNKYHQDLYQDDDHSSKKRTSRKEKTTLNNQFPIYTDSGTEEPQEPKKKNPCCSVY